MDKYLRAPDHEGAGSADPTSVAESVRTDFTALVAILDRHLSSVAEEDEQSRGHILQAKAAAERGLLLSSKLIDLLSTAEVKN